MSSPVPVLRVEDIEGRVPLSDITSARAPELVYERLRTRWGAVAPVDLEPGVPAWLVLGYDEAVSVLRDDLQYTRDSRRWRRLADGELPRDSAVRALLAPGDGVHHVDGAQHRRLRAPIDDALGAVDEKRLAQTVAVTCDAVIDRLAVRGEADLVADYAVAVTVMVLAELMGLSLADAKRMHELTDALRSGSPEACPAAAEHENLLAVTVAQHRAEPGDDLTTVLLGHPHHVNDLETMGAVGAVFGSAHDGEVAWIAGTLHLLLTDPEFRARVHGGRLDLDGALDEVARRHPPLPHLLPRFALRDGELGGQRIASGDAVVVAVAAANADGAVRPDDPWEELGSRFHLTWGTGAHACPAHRLGPLVCRIAVDRILRRLADMTLTVPADALELTRSPWSRYPRRLPVRFTAQA
ncbi:cytochrome P450 [Xylanimonas sp. McL0601]|uniref:cytochrome P450 n=1 Tax=Xylanimonas sp. McL0601 TaxID=3414739 RepID=UPI003CE7C13F